MPEVSFTPLTDQGAALLDQLEAEAGVYPFRMRRDGGRSYAADLDDLAAVFDQLRPDWREHVAQTG